ncbi:MAG: hypothetical protein ACKO1M_07620 [Planctomycetota bacterium]
MTRTSQLAAHYAVLQLDAHLDHAVMHYRNTVDLLVEEFWEHFPQRQRDARLLDPDGKRAHDELVGLLHNMRGNALRDARTYLALRARCGRDKDDLPELDPAVMQEFRRLADAHGAAENERKAAAAAEVRRRAARADDDAFDDALERWTEAEFDYANGEGPGPWFAAAREGGAG